MTPTVSTGMDGASAASVVRCPTPSRADVAAAVSSITQPPAGASWFRLSPRYSFRVWAEITDAGRMAEVRAWLAETERRIADELQGAAR